MAYEKHTWSNGEVITADKMNNIEEGIDSKGIAPYFSNEVYVNVTELTVEGGSWTAPSNGFLYVYGVKDNDKITSEITIKINNSSNTDIRYKAVDSAIFYFSTFVPLRKGDVLNTISYTNIYSGGVPVFIPSV